MAKKNHQVPPQVMTMHARDVLLRMKLLQRWDYLCIICGEEFKNLASVTKEHLVPRSAPDHMKPSENLAPSHYNCNRVRSADSLIDAAKVLDLKKTSMTPEAFAKWINQPVPHRIVPESAMLPLRRRPLACLELPEHLPGMSCRR